MARHLDVDEKSVQRWRQQQDKLQGVCRNQWAAFYSAKIYVNVQFMLSLYLVTIFDSFVLCLHSLNYQCFFFHQINC